MISSFVKSNFAQFTDERAGEVEPLLSCMEVLVKGGYKEAVLDLLDVLCDIYGDYLTKTGRKITQETIKNWDELENKIHESYNEPNL